LLIPDALWWSVWEEIMTRTTTGLIIVLALAGAFMARTSTAAIPTPVNGQITDAVDGIDNNRNGSVDSKEWHIAGDRTFRALDSDKDGHISADEFALIHGVLFPVMDTNHDGELTVTEAAEYQRLPWTLGLFR
jgi:hypothetical protein